MAKRSDCRVSLVELNVFGDVLVPKPLRNFASIRYAHTLLN